MAPSNALILLLFLYRTGGVTAATDALETTKFHVDTDYTNFETTPPEWTTVASSIEDVNAEQTSETGSSMSWSTQAPETTTSFRGYRRVTRKPGRVLSPRSLSKAVLDIVASVQSTSIQLRRLSSDVSTLRTETFERLYRLEVEMKNAFNVHVLQLRNRVGQSQGVSVTAVTDLKKEVSEKFEKLEEEISRRTDSLAGELKRDREDKEVRGMNRIQPLAATLQVILTSVKDAEDNCTEKLALIEDMLQEQTTRQASLENEFPAVLKQAEENISRHIDGVTRNLEQLSREEKDRRNEVYNEISNVTHHVQGLLATFNKSEKFSAESFAAIESQAKRNGDRLEQLETNVADCLNKTEDVLSGQVGALAREVRTFADDQSHYRRESIKRLNVLALVPVNLAEVNASLTTFRKETFQGFNDTVEKVVEHMAHLNAAVSESARKLAERIPNNIAEAVADVVLKVKIIEEASMELKQIRRKTDLIISAVQSIRRRVG